MRSSRCVELGCQILILLSASQVEKLVSLHEQNRVKKFLTDIYINSTCKTNFLGNICMLNSIMSHVKFAKIKLNKLKSNLQTYFLEHLCAPSTWSWCWLQPEFAILQENDLKMSRMSIGLRVGTCQSYLLSPYKSLYESTQLSMTPYFL